MDTSSVSLALAFVAGLASFFSPCVLPVVPGYVAFVTGMTLEELSGELPPRARRGALAHAALFVIGFSLLFVALGAGATLAGGAVRRALPVMQQVGGVAVALFGAYLLGLVRIPALMRERRLHLTRRPAGAVGSVLAGVAFGAGWTPCVGPVLASVLLFAGMEAAPGRGMLLLGAYALGLGIPFLLAAVALHFFMAGSSRLRRWLVPLERATGAVLVLLGVMLASGRFARITAFLAQFAPAIQVGG